jgi:integrase
VRIKITKRSVDAMQPIEGKDVLIFDTEIAGFVCKLTPTRKDGQGAEQEGSRTYLLQYKTPEGRTRRYRIGKHGEMTAEQARERARRLRVQVSDGVDPFAERTRQREIPTVADLGKRYMAEHALVHKRASSAAEDGRNLDNHIVPLLGHLKASAVTAEDVARMVRSIAAGDTARDEKTEHGRRIVKGGKIAANRARALLSTMMNLAETWGYRPGNSNPCGGARRFLEEKRQRFLTGDELARLGRTLAAAETEGLDRPAGENSPVRKIKENPATIAAIRLLLFTGCRLSEIRTLRWSHVDSERAMLNLPTSKTGAKPVFLSAPALQVLAGLKRPQDGTDAFVFSALRRRRRDEPKTARPIEDLRGAWERVREAAGMPELRLHDLRHTFASMGAAGGLSLQLIGGLLGHSSIRTTQRYAHLVDEAQRDAVERIGTDLARAVAGRKVSGSRTTAAKRARDRA